MIGLVLLAYALDDPAQRATFPLQHPWLSKSHAITT